MNNYHIYEKIGRGKHSTVYKGRKKKTIQYYAIKSVDKSQKARVLQEVRTMHALDHKNVLHFYAWYETTNHLWLILEYCVGGDLMSLLRQDVKLPETSVHDFARDLAVALQYLHANSIVYCDLKPSNILMDENGRLKLGGFGLSRRLSEINKTPLQSLPPAKRGTPAYMAPELFSDGATHSSASDLWALGCVLYECTAGRPPFMNSSFNQLVQDILNNEPPPIPGISSEFVDLLARMLDKNPATRIAWKALVLHPFWHIKMPHLDMPPEPALEAFIRKNFLAPSEQDASRDELRASKAGERARSMRQSVDVMRLSRIALTNLEREGDGSDYQVAEPRTNDIQIENADAELDFEEERDEAMDEDEPPSPAMSDDGSALDQGAMSTDGGTAGGAVSGSGRMDMQLGAMDGDAVKAQSRLRGATEAAGGAAARPPSRGGEEGPSISGRGGAGVANAGGTGGSLDDDVMEMDTLVGRAGLEGGTADLALIWHASDTVVKPIVANRRIERLPEPRFTAQELPFTPLSLQEMLHADQKALEMFLTQIYRAIAGVAPLKDKVNVLSYFETLCVDTNAANVLINSSLTILFIRMLRNARAPTLRIRLASVLGLLVRHATYIAEELAQTNVIDVLSEALKDRNERVRRRVMATLGELLFYIATQQQDGGGTSTTGGTVAEVTDCWSINNQTVGLVTRLLKPQEDEIAQHYAVKTIENICSQGGEWAAKFATQDVVFNLIQIYNSGRGEHLKATTASTLCRLLRHSPSLVAYVVDKHGVHLFIAGLNDPSSKVQTAAVNCLNLVLSLPELSTRGRASLFEERSLLPHLTTLLDHSLPLLRAKAVVSILLLCRLSTRWLLEVCKAKIIPVVEKLQREKDEYLQQAVAALRAEFGRLVPVMCAQITEELSKSSTSRRGGSGPPSPAPRTSASSVAAAKSPLVLFQVVLHLMTSPYFRAPLVTPKLVSDLAAFLHACAGGSSATGVAEFLATLMHVLEAICQQADLVLAQHDAVLSSLLPALCDVVASTAESGDTRFFCLRMVSDVTQLFLLDAELYGDAVSPESDRRTGSAATAIDAALQKHILPIVPQLLQDEDPMPLYALKLLGGLLEVNVSYVRVVEELGLAAQFFDFLSLEHSNNNVHNIRLCRQVVAAGALPSEELQRLQISDKVSAVLEYAQQNNVEPFLEPVLELCHAIIERDSADVADGRSDGSLMASFLDQAPAFLELCMNPDAPVATAAATCVTDMMDMYPEQCAPWLLAADSAAIIVSVLLGEHLENGAAAPSPVLQLLLSSVCRAAAVPLPDGESPPDVEELRKLYDAVRNAASTGDTSVRALANDAARGLAVLMH